MYYRKRRPRSSIDDSESFEARRARRQLARRKSERLLLFIIILGPFGLFAVYQFGRSLFYMRNVSAFVQRLDQMPAAEVKVELRRYASDLSSANPLVRNGALAALKAATGWRLGSDINEWKQWWSAREATWEYRRGGPTNAPASVDWRQHLPVVTDTVPAEP